MLNRARDDGLPRQGRLHGKRALITGAGGLMGSDIARAFAAEGANLVLTTRTASKLVPLQRELSARGVKVAVHATDFSDPSQIDDLADQAWGALEGIDVVFVSSQPANPNFGELLDCPDSAWHDQQQAIVWGPLRLLRRLVPQMKAAGGGSIITVVSSTGFEPTPGYGAYGMAKGALWLLTQYMAKEWGKYGIRANAMTPGLIATGDNAQELEQAVRANGMLSRTSLGHVGRNQDCLGAAVYLASDESSFVSGQRINIDGGRF